MRKAVGLGKEGGVDVDEAKTPERGEEVAREVQCRDDARRVVRGSKVGYGCCSGREVFASGSAEADVTMTGIGKRGHPRGSLAS